MIGSGGDDIANECAMGVIWYDIQRERVVGYRLCTRFIKNLSRELAFTPKLKKLGLFFCG